MNEKYTIYHYVKNVDGQYVSQTIWTGGHLIPFVCKVISLKFFARIRYLGVNINI